MVTERSLSAVTIPSHHAAMKLSRCIPVSLFAGPQYPERSRGKYQVVCRLPHNPENWMNSMLIAGEVFSPRLVKGGLTDSVALSPAHLEFDGQVIFPPDQVSCRIRVLLFRRSFFASGTLVCPPLSDFTSRCGPSELRSAQGFVEMLRCPRNRAAIGV